MRYSREHRIRRGSLWSLLRSLPRAAGEVFSGLAAAWLSSGELRRRQRVLAWNEGAVRSITCQLYKTAEGCRRERIGISAKPDGTAISGRSPDELPVSDHLLIQRIHEAVTEANKSNITRTRAYIAFYEEYPEIHWALLAHMVSRNAGWNMTDLKSGLMSDLTDSRFKEHMYRFLERCNALIFQDAYPQLLLYKHSRELKRSCFHLLPHFHVSAFMTPFWERFWMDRSSSLLTVALIINEQNYIEGRVVRHPYFRQNVLRHPSLRLYEMSRLNQVIFPLGSSNCRHDLFKESILPLRPLTGITMNHFADPSARIKAGKTLYAMLFGYDAVFQGVLQFVHCSPHLGSREEYWPALFTFRRKNALDTPNESSELLQWEWLPEGNRMYSPRWNRYGATPNTSRFPVTTGFKNRPCSGI
ncbi:DUF2515 family protein [Paenibacillus sp. DMB20]|uniref:DUF2515 family protein n=1 Tax=Paenibacillus sp. DMB20 TaxID=1642570 RepID=UPI001F220EB7|nr:DUF2515 family protein [Paenibacillus sp. DMB20]